MNIKFYALASAAIFLLSGCNKSEAARQSSTGSQQASPQVSSGDTASGLINLSDLPKEGQKEYELIGKGGPFPYKKDGSIFSNREGVLPKQARGYYREYTVKTPGERDRGARRIVCGGQPNTSLNECYYTSDHYTSFRKIKQ